MIIFKTIFMLYLEVCATVCTVQLIMMGLGKVDKYITKRRKAKQEANKPVVQEVQDVEQESIFDADEFLEEVKKDSEEFREYARLFMENSKKYQDECKVLLAKNDKHLEFLMNSKGIDSNEIR